MDLREKACWVALNHLIDIGPRRFQALLEHFQAISALWQASHASIEQVPGLPRGVAGKLWQHMQRTRPERIYEQILASQMGVVTLAEPDYPALLKTIYDPPPVLYYKGHQSYFQALQRTIAVIGTRQATPYGKAVAFRLGQELAQAGIAVVSGMAYGIDSEAHRGSLADSGLTVAVLASGADVPSPPGNQSLYGQICERGLVLSENTPGSQPYPWSFPRRNRLVSGLCNGLVVVESGAKSGTTITVDCALEQGREIFAVPGPINSPMSQGTNSLIQQGAHLLDQAREIFEVLGWKPRPSSLEQGVSTSCDTMINLTNAEKEVYLLLNETPQHIDRIVERYPSDAANLVSLLLMLELKGVLEQLPGKYFKIK